jgi:hypothetical protein
MPVCRPEQSETRLGPEDASHRGADLRARLEPQAKSLRSRSSGDLPGCKSKSSPQCVSPRRERRLRAAWTLNCWVPSPGSAMPE